MSNSKKRNFPPIDPVYPDHELHPIHPTAKCDADLPKSWKTLKRVHILSKGVYSLNSSVSPVETVCVEGSRQGVSPQAQEQLPVLAMRYPHSKVWDYTKQVLSLRPHLVQVSSIVRILGSPESNLNRSIEGLVSRICCSRGMQRMMECLREREKGELVYSFMLLVSYHCWLD